MSASAQQGTLAAKRKLWFEVLSGKDKHSVVHQITAMTWNAAAYQVVNKARRLAPADPEGGVQLNGMLHRLIDHGFFNTHMAAIRRLMDRSSLEGKKGVYSLVALLDDMKQNRELMTRKAIFEAEGRPYDYGPVRQRRLQYGRQERKAGERVPHVPRHLWWRDHERRHQDIDRLSATSQDNRQPGDTVLKDVFSNLRRKAVSASEHVVTYVTKFIAHAASPESRADVRADEARITLHHLWKAHRSLCEVASFIAIVILGDSCPSFLPIPQYNHFKYIDRRLVDPSDVPKLQELWQSFERECHDWSQWTLDDYEREFGERPQG